MSGLSEDNLPNKGVQPGTVVSIGQPRAADGLGSLRATGKNTGRLYSAVHGRLNGVDWLSSGQDRSHVRAQGDAGEADDGFALEREHGDCPGV